MISDDDFGNRPIFYCFYFLGIYLCVADDVTFPHGVGLGGFLMLGTCTILFCENLVHESTGCWASG